MDQESSLELIQRAQAGDHAALDRLLTRYLPRLRRWATGRLPRHARAMTDTDDLVQHALIGTFKNIGAFEGRGEWALQAYLRQAVTNRIRDELERAEHQHQRTELAEDIPDSGVSPLEQAMGTEAFQQYDTALAALDPTDREAVIARLELGCSYREIAALVNKPTPDAARMVVSRALTRLAGTMAKTL